MKPASTAQQLEFILRFYEQTVEVITAVLNRARQSHPGITGWSHAPDLTAALPCTAATLKFSDQASFDGFVTDEQFINAYLESAWGRRPLTRESLRISPPRGDERGTIPSAMFNEIGI